MGFETVVRSRFGIDEDDLTDTELNQPLIVDLAEALIKKRVPRYSVITDVEDLLFLQNAVIAQICVLLCPSMSRRLDLKVAVSDVKIEKEKIDWVKQAELYNQEIDFNLSNITTEGVVLNTGSSDSVVSIIRNTRSPIGGE